MAPPSQVKPNGPAALEGTGPLIPAQSAHMLISSMPHGTATAMHRRRSIRSLAALAAPALAVVAAGLAMPTGGALAACNCRCVDGRATAVCSSSTDIRPFCQQTSTCPMVLPRKSPLDARKPVPTVKPGCETKQVYDPKTNAYLWEQICP